MPYPPKYTFGGTTPGTALETQVHARSAGGVGNAHTVGGTANDAGMIGSAMAPYNAPTIYTYAAEAYGKENVGIINWTPSVPGQAGGTPAGSVHIGISFADVYMSAADILLATLTLYSGGPPTGSPVLLLKAVDADAPAVFSGSAYPSIRTPTTAIAANLDLGDWGATTETTFDISDIITELVASYGAGTRRLCLMLLDDSSPASNYITVGLFSGLTSSPLKLQYDE